MLTADFLGVHPQGFANRGDHVEQLTNGTSVESFELSAARLITINDAAAMLSYRADFCRSGTETTQPETTQPETTQPETTQPETTYVSSLWCRRNNNWVNVFSQHTPAQNDL